MTETAHHLISSLDDSVTGGPTTTVRIIDLRLIKEALSRHRGVWLLCAVLGLAVGASFHLVVPTTYVARTTLYLAEPANLGSYTIADDVSLLDTTKVAKQALQLVGQDGTNGRLGVYRGAALGTVLLEMSADGPTPGEAVRWARALAEAFLSVRAETLNGQTRLAVSALEFQIKALQAEAARLDRSIADLTGGSPSTSSANQVGQLVSARGSAEAQLLNLNAEVQQDDMSESSLVKGSYVLDPPLVITPSKARIFAEDGLSGLVAGLALGIGLPVIGAVLSDRPRRREVVALLLNAPVLLSLRKSRRFRRDCRIAGRRSGKRTVGREMRRANAVVLNCVDGQRPGSVALIAVGKGSAKAGAGMLAAVAASATKNQQRVLLVDLTERRQLEHAMRVRSRNGTGPNVALVSEHASLIVGSAGVEIPNAAQQRQDFELVLVLADADPSIGLDHLVPWADQAIAVISAGQASEVLVQATADMLAAAQLTALGCILLNADRRDESFGSDRTVHGSRDARRRGTDVPGFSDTPAPSSLRA